MVELESDEAAFCEVELWQAVSQHRETMRQINKIFFIINQLYQIRSSLGQEKHWIRRKRQDSCLFILLVKTLCQLRNNLFLPRDCPCQEGMVVFQCEVKGRLYLVHIGAKGQDFRVGVDNVCNHEDKV